MTTDMIPVRVGNEDGGQRRQPKGVRAKGFVRAFSEVRPCARINADQFTAIFRHHKVVFGELETGERIDAAGDDFRDTPWKKSVSRDRFLRKRCSERDWVVKVCIAAATEIILSLVLLALTACEFG